MARRQEEAGHPSLRETVAANIYAARKARGWSQEELARRTPGGLSKETIRTLENSRHGGGRDVYLETIEKIAFAFGVDAWELLRFDVAATRVYLQRRNLYSLPIPAFR